MRKEEIDIIEKFIEANKLPFPNKLGVRETNIVVEMIYEIWKRGNEREQPTGKWISFTDDYRDYAKCSECDFGEEGEVYLEDITSYCPHCGKKMIFVEDGITGVNI